MRKIWFSFNGFVKTAARKYSMQYLLGKVLAKSSEFSSLFRLSPTKEPEIIDVG